MKIAFLGLGNMGRAMARNVIRAGHEVTVYNRTAKAAEALADLKPAVAATPAETAEGAELIITMVSDATAVAALLEGTDGVLAGAGAGGILVDMSTIAPPDSRRFADMAAKHGLRWLDSPVAGSTGAAAARQLVALVGGEEATFAEAEAVLLTMCRAAHHLGPAGSGTAAKLAINLLVGVQVLALAEAVRLAEAGGLTRDRFLQVAADTTVASPLMQLKAPLFVADDYPPAFALKLMQKDMGLITEAAEAGDVPATLAQAALERYARAAADGLGDLDFAAVIRTLKP